MRSYLVAVVAASWTMSCAPTDRSSGPAGSLPPCEEPACPRLESYSDVQMPATYWVDMIAGGGEWRPASHIAMPHHHATRLELANLAEFPAMVDRQGERVRFTVEITSREIHQVSGRREWRATYHARIVAVCLPK